MSSTFADSLAEFSKAASKYFGEVENRARQQVAQTESQVRQQVADAVAEAREARAERDKLVKELSLQQLETLSWKEEAASSKAALSQAERTIAHQVEVVVQLRREINQWKDQARNWQDHFLRVEGERCAQSSFILEKLEKFPHIRSSPKQTNQTTSATSSVTVKPHISPQPTIPPAYSQSTTNEEASSSASQAEINANSSNATRPPDPSSKKFKAPLPETVTKSSRVRPRRSNGNNQAAETSSPQTQSHQQARSGSSTVIRRVQAVVNVKHEDDSDAKESSDDHVISSPTKDVKRKKGDPQGSTEHNKRKTMQNNRVLSDDESKEIQAQSDAGEALQLRKLSRIDYREEDNKEEEDEDELMIGAGDKNHEPYRIFPVAQPRKKRKHSLR